jgi:hypothetical protein
MTKCGARTRRGTPCQRHGLGRKGRCRLHGGASTGPRPEGRERIAAHQREKWAAWRAKYPRAFPHLSKRQEQRIRARFRQETAAAALEQRQRAIRNAHERKLARHAELAAINAFAVQLIDVNERGRWVQPERRRGRRTRTP